MTITMPKYEPEPELGWQLELSRLLQALTCLIWTINKKIEEEQKDAKCK